MQEEPVSKMTKVFWVCLSFLLLYIYRGVSRCLSRWRLGNFKFFLSVGDGGLVKKLADRASRVTAPKCEFSPWSGINPVCRGRENLHYIKCIQKKETNSTKEKRKKEVTLRKQNTKNYRAHIERKKEKECYLQ
jgi:hypothetical protein